MPNPTEITFRKVFGGHFMFIAKLIVKLIIPVFVCNWLIAEAELFFPGVAEFTHNIVNEFQIPTHDRWEESPEFSFSGFGEKIDNYLESISDHDLSIFSQTANENSLSYNADIDLASLEINTDEIFDGKELFASLNYEAPSLGLVEF